MSENNSFSIQLLGTTWQIRCPEDKKLELQKCAKYLDQKIQEVTATGTIKNNERIIMMAAINVIYDLLQQIGQKDLYIDSLSSRVRELQNKIPRSPIPHNQELEI